MDKQENKIIPFDYHGHEVRTVTVNGELRFIATDVCELFGDTNRNRTMQNLDADEKGYTQMNTPGGIQKMSTVNEPGLYSMLFAMQPKKARGVSDEYIAERTEQLKQFKRWVTHEVIPTIRKTGGYVNNSAQFVAAYFPQLTESQQSIICAMLDESKRMGEQIKQDAPKVMFSDAVSGSCNSILIRELAHMMRQNGVQIGEHRLFQWLRDNGFIHKNSEAYNQPTQYSLERGLMEVKETAVIVPGKGPRTRITPKVTGKGQTYFIRRFCKLEKLKVGEKA